MDDAFHPALIGSRESAPNPLGRAVLLTCTAFIALLLVGLAWGRVDVVAVAPGKLVPRSRLQIVQPAESGIVREILVREGERVAAGAVLMRMDPTLSAADADQIRVARSQRLLQLRRSESELTGRPFTVEPGDPEALFRLVSTQYAANRSAHDDALAEVRAVLQRARDQLAAAIEDERSLEVTLSHYRDREQAYAALAAKGLAGRLQADEMVQARVEREQELRAQRHRVAALRSEVAESEQRLARVGSERRARLLNEQVDVRAELERLDLEWRKQAHRHSLLELTAPRAGIVKDLATHTPGSVVAPGTVLMTLVPVDEPLYAEVWVNDLDIGFVHAGQPVQIKLAAFPFYRYGLIPGTVVSVGADVTETGAPAAAESTDSGQGRQARFRTIVEPSTLDIDADGRRHRLTPGMQVNAEIRLRDRTVLDYLWSPLRRTLHEAGREL